MTTRSMLESVGYYMNDELIQKLIDILTDIKTKGKDSRFILKELDTEMRICEPINSYNSYTFSVGIYEKRFP